MARAESSSYGSYTRMAIALHWAMAFAIIGLLGAGWWMTWALEAADEGSRRLAYEVIQIHKALGLSVLALSLFRLFWRLRHPAPPLPANMPGWQKSLSAVSHFCLYGFMIGAPLSGWIMVSASPEFSSLPTSMFGLFLAPHLPAAEVSSALLGMGAKETAGLAREAHHILAFLGGLLLLLHIAAALKHHFSDRDHILARMTPGVEPRQPVFEPPAPKPSALARGLANGMALSVICLAASLFLFASGGVKGPSGQSRAVQTSSQPSSPQSAASKTAGEDGATAPRWDVDPAKSAIRFSGAHLGSPFAGVFERWRADIRFDPGALEAGRVRVEIETASAVTEEAQYDGALPQADWFNAAEHPLAVFAADRFEAAEATGRYRAVGTLTIKGVSLPAVLPFALQIDGAEAVMTAELTLDRLAYGLGEAADPAATFVSKEVKVSITTVARRAGDAESASK